MNGILVARWQGCTGTSLEHLVLDRSRDGLAADSAVLAIDGAVAYAARYRLACDPEWRVRRVEVGLIGDPRTLSLCSDGAGHWSDATGAPQPELDGAIDVDISATPFTNTLPICRLRLRAGQVAEIRAVYVLLPDLTLSTDEQRYTCLEEGRRYRYESVDGSFTRDLEVDDHGLIVVYPGLFRRVL